MSYVSAYPIIRRPAPADRWSALRWAVVGCAAFWTATGIVVLGTLS